MKPWLVGIADPMTERMIVDHSLPNGCRLAMLSKGNEDEREQTISKALVLVASRLSPGHLAAAENLLLVQVPGAGTDGIPMDRLSPRVSVANTGHHGRAIGEYVIMAMVAASRDIVPADRALRSSKWLAPHLIPNPLIELSPNLEGRTVLVLGYGEIGRNVAQLAARMDMKVRVVTRSFTERSSEFVDEFVGFGELPAELGRCDFVVLALPLTDETRHLFDRDRLNSMGSNTILINVGRGPLVDPVALFHALSNQSIGGAVLDVWYSYPDRSPVADPAPLPFADLENVLMTPHISGVTSTTFERRTSDVVENLYRFSQGRPLLNTVRAGQSRFLS